VASIAAVAGWYGATLLAYTPILCVALRSTAGCRQRQERRECATRLRRLGWMRWSEGSDVGCSHAGGCPLFPLLRASLQSWRDYYCDSEDRWHDCARYKLARRGELVPISLLPNGHEAWHLRSEADAYWSTVNQRQAHGQVSPSWPEPWAQETAPWFEPAPPQPPPAPPRLAGHRPRPLPSPRVTHQTQQIGSSDQHAWPASPKRGWWARLVDWMRGPA
jgi:hypothetical protein